MTTTVEAVERAWIDKLNSVEKAWTDNLMLAKRESLAEIEKLHRESCAKEERMHTLAEHTQSDWSAREAAMQKVLSVVFHLYFKIVFDFI